MNDEKKARAHIPLSVNMIWYWWYVNNATILLYGVKGDNYE